MQAGILIVILLIIILLVISAKRKKAPLPQPDFQTEKDILQQQVSFYKKLSPEEKLRFEVSIQTFLQKVKITGIETEVEDIDRVFIAAGAIIPIFAFKGWEYQNIHEVLLYPNSFSKEYQTEGSGRNTLGMVGNGAMSNIMILSQQDLRAGFLNHTDKSNTAIHEFVHLVDKSDGSTDGTPAIFQPSAYILPWVKRIQYEVQQIEAGKSDINPYATTNEAEFLAVISEYFFEQPQLMQKKHPILFEMLTQIFSPATVS